MLINALVALDSKLISVRHPNPMPVFCSYVTSVAKHTARQEHHLQDDSLAAVTQWQVSPREARERVEECRSGESSATGTSGGVPRW